MCEIEKGSKRRAARLITIKETSSRSMPWHGAVHDLVFYLVNFCFIDGEGEALAKTFHPLFLLFALEVGKQDCLHVTIGFGLFEFLAYDTTDFEAAIGFHGFIYTEDVVVHVGILAFLAEIRSADRDSYGVFVEFFFHDVTPTFVLGFLQKFRDFLELVFVHGVDDIALETGFCPGILFLVSLIPFFLVH